MNILETLYFPDTALFSYRQLPLFLLFAKVHIIDPVNDEQSPKSSADIFMESKFCQAHTPHPLEEDKDRFLYLINDIKNRKDDYAAQLSHVTLASMSEKKGKDDESQHRIMSTLLGRQTEVNTKADTSEKDILWQARLVLKIAEILDREEDEVARALAFLNDSEDELFNRLKGSENDEETNNIYLDLQKISRNLGKPRTESIAKRMKAWFRFTAKADLPSLPIWSTCRQEVADILFENYEKVHGSAPSQIATITLPTGLGGTDTNLDEQIDVFHSICDKHLTTFFDKVTTVAPGSACIDFSTTEMEWDNLINHHYPPSKHGRTTVQFYFFEKQIPCYSTVSAAESMQAAKILAFFNSDI